MYCYLTRVRADLTEPRGSVQGLLKSTFNAENFICCLGLSPAVSVQFSLKMCVEAQNRKQFNQNPYFMGSRSFKVINVDKPKKPVTSACRICRKSVPICNRFCTIANNKSQ